MQKVQVYSHHSLQCQQLVPWLHPYQSSAFIKEAKILFSFEKQAYEVCSKLISAFTAFFLQWKMILLLSSLRERGQPALSASPCKWWTLWPSTRVSHQKEAVWDCKSARVSHPSERTSPIKDQFVRLQA